MSNLLESIAVIAGSFTVVKLIKWQRININEKRVLEKRQAFRNYVENGKKDKAYYTLSSRAIKAAHKQRVRNLNFKAAKNKEFTAFSECPNCNSFGVHYIKKQFYKYYRECIECEYLWRQQ